MAFFEELFVLFLIGNSITALANKHGGTFINSYNYAYDGNGNLVAKLDIGGTTTYTYDALNRLASVTEPGGKVTEYAFDEAGNRETQEVTAGTDISLTTYTYNAQNQLLYATEAAGSASTSTVFFYDHNGNTISKHEETIDTSAGSLELSLTIPGSGQKAYTANTYDVFNQLISSKDQDSTSAYKYNGDGLRVGKSVTENGTTTVTQFIYEYDKVVLELDGNGSQTAYNVYGNDMLLSRTSGGTTLYYLYNGHGDVVNIADATGTVVMTYDYDAFGNVTVATGSVANSYLYAGYQFDDETGMYYLNSRYYDPVVARFISADTYLGQANDPLSLNLYTYCVNNPIMYSDPTGYDSVPVTVTLTNGSTVQTVAVDGRTIMPDGTRPPAGSIVTSGGNSWQVPSNNNNPGVPVTTVQVTVPSATNPTGTSTVGVVNNGVTTMADGSRPPVGSVVTSGGTSWQVVDTNKPGVLVTAVPITYNETTTMGTVTDGHTYTVNGDPVPEGTFVQTAGGDFLMVAGSGVPVIKSTNDLGETFYRFNPEFKLCSNNIVYVSGSSKKGGPSGLMRDSDDIYKYENPIVYQALHDLAASYNNLLELEKDGIDTGNMKLEIINLANQIRKIGISKYIPSTVVMTNNKVYADLTSTEAVIYFSDKFKGAMVGLASKDAADIVPNNLDGTKENAIKHALWNALATSWAGEEYTKYFTDAHEYGNPKNFLDKESLELSKMDLYNNAVGRQLGKKKPAGDFKSEYDLYDDLQKMRTKVS